MLSIVPGETTVAGKSVYVTEDHLTRTKFESTPCIFRSALFYARYSAKSRCAFHGSFASIAQNRHTAQPSEIVFVSMEGAKAALDACHRLAPRIHSSSTARINGPRVVGLRWGAFHDFHPR